MMRRTTGAWLIVLSIAALARPHACAGRRRIAWSTPPSEAAELADLLGRLLQPALQPADADHAGQRQEPRAEMDVPGAVAGNWQSTPLVVDGVMYLTQRPNDVVALDATTGRVFWIYRYTPRPDAGRLLRREQPRPRDPRRHAVHGHARRAPVAIDAKTGRPLWNDEVADSKAGYSITLAPLVVKDKVIVGVGGGEYGIRGFIAAFDARTGKEAWRFYTIPAPGEPGGETWKPCPPATTTFCDPEAWKHGGGSIWVTGSYDPAEPDVLGRRQRRARLERRAAARRQPLHRLGRRARRRHRQAEVALPVHAARRLRLRLGAGAGARRHHVAGHSRARRCSGRTATATSTCSIARPASSSSASRS